MALQRFIDMQPVNGNYAYRYEKLDSNGNGTGEYIYLKYAPGSLVNTPTPLNSSTFNPIVDYINNLDKSDVGLSNVDNTSDANKSVKYATSAGNATNDSDGKQISTTYQKKSWTRVYNQLVGGSATINLSIDFSNYNEILFIVGGVSSPGTYNFPTDEVKNETLSLYNGFGSSNSGGAFYFTSKTLTMIEHYANYSERITIYAR